MFSIKGVLHVRPVEATDERFVYELFCSVRGIEFEYAELSLAEKEQFLRSQFQAMHGTYAQRFPDGKHYIVVNQGEDIGRIYVNESNEEIRLLDVIIHPNQRNQGIGSQLMQQMIQHSEQTGKAIRFYVWQTNYAGQRFYERHGFKQIRNDNAYLLFELIPTPST